MDGVYLCLSYLLITTLDRYKYQMNLVQFANQELDWFSTDSEDLYQHNLDKSLKYMHFHNQVDNRFTYKFNSNGFRADEFDSGTPNVVSLGCSHTLGIGNPYESTWAYKVSTSLKLKNFNLAIAGSASDTAFRMAYQWIDKLKPNIVIFLSPDQTRFELNTTAYPYVNDTHYINVKDYEWSDHTKVFMKHWYSDDTNSNMNYLKNMLAIKQLCNERDIKFLHKEVTTIYEQKIFAGDHARDLMHFGATTHQRIADMFLSKL
jgi:hypothetical protein